MRRRMTWLLMLMPFAAAVLMEAVFPAGEERALLTPEREPVSSFFEAEMSVPGAYDRSPAAKTAEIVILTDKPAPYETGAPPSPAHGPVSVPGAAIPAAAVRDAPPSPSLPAEIKTAPGEGLRHEDAMTLAARQESGDRVSLGTFTITAYCACAKCCGKWSGQRMSIPTESGVPYPVEGYTVSVDPDVIPLKSTIVIDGIGGRYAHDTGGAIKGKRIDLYFADHQDALRFGRQALEVWLVG